MGIDQAKTIGAPDPMLLSPAPALWDRVTWGKAWTMRPSRGSCHMQLCLHLVAKT